MKLSRRTFLFLTGSTGMAMAAEPGRQMVNKLIPYVVAPEKIKPGRWGHYATTCRECPAGCGMHLWHRDGRITKAEGNPGHPLNRGALCARGQSSMQGLYDPDRLRGVVFGNRQGKPEQAFWGKALDGIARQLREAKGRVAILSNLQTGALAEVMTVFAAAFDTDRLIFHEAFNYQPLREAHRLLFERGEIPRYQLEDCEFIVSFACDFLETWVSPVEFANRFGRMHGWRDGRIGRFAYIGPRLSMTAGSADDLLMVQPGQERFVALAMLQVMVERGWCRTEAAGIARLVAGMGGDLAMERCGLPERTVVALAAAFIRAKSALALAGPQAASGAAARDTALAAALLNLAAGQIGRTVDFSRPHALSETAGDQQLNRFLAGLGRHDVLIVHGSNPAFSRPKSREHLERVGTLVHLTTLPDETSRLADWLLPLDASAESWGDYAPYAGIEGLLQPTMARLYDTRTAGDILLELARRADRPLVRPGSGTIEDFYGWLEARWRNLHRDLRERRSFARFWEEARRGGGFWREVSPVRISLRPDSEMPPFSPAVPAAKPGQIALWLYPSIFLFDGSTANRGWIQETPDPISTVVWGSWVDLHPRTALSLDLHKEQVVRLRTAYGSLEVPVRISRDVVEGVAALPIGQGHSAPGLSVACGIGGNPFTLIGEDTPPEANFPPVAIEKTDRYRPPVALSPTRQQFGRHLLRTLPLSELRRRRPGEGERIIMPLPEGYIPTRDLYPPHQHRGHRWAMVVDLQRCIGCGACAVACYAENNIAVVGRKGTAEGLEMAWLKAVPYRPAENKRRIHWLPVLCQHCDAAPCEPVCPVFAAVHSEEGLNAQIYNRCVGTRYCSNNCPYKVRRFNWADPVWKNPLELQLNPEVTVRCRGVMEKCTFCVQRIRQAEYRARLEKRKLRDGEIRTACQQTCPTGVFTFGDLLDPESQVSRMFSSNPRRYQLLRELNTKPAIVYLSKIRQEDL